MEEAAPGTGRPKKVVWTGSVSVRVPMTDQEVKSMGRNRQSEVPRRPSAQPMYNLFAR